MADIHGWLLCTLNECVLRHTVLYRRPNPTYHYLFLPDLSARGCARVR